MKNHFSLYIHIPYCISKCTYCDFYSMPVGKTCLKKVPDLYIDAVENEIKERISSDRLCISVYIGGGTPSLLTEEQLVRINKILRSNINFIDDFEFTIECNPDDVSDEFLQICNSIGVNRLSCGIQSLNDGVLKTVNRRAGTVENLAALEKLKKWKGVRSIDLISSLPGETEESFISGLEKVTSIMLEHISLYALTVEEETVLGKEIDSGKIKYDFDSADEMWIKGRDYLISKGYKQYEVSNFCKEGFECKHNMSYWKHKNYIGIGSGATGTEYGASESIRITNTSDTEKYIQYWTEKNIDYTKIITSEIIDKKTEEFEFFMMGLRTSFGVLKSDYEKIFSKSFPSSIDLLFKKWQEKNFACIVNIESDTNYSLNTEGLLFLNTFLEQLLDL